MKKMMILIALFAANASAKDVYVQPHMNSNGTYVQGYERTAPDRSQYNNYSTQGNVNPYTGQQGTRQPQPNYGQPAGNNRGQSGVCPYGQNC